EGLPKHRIEEAAAARAARVDTGETVIVGVNRYRLAEEEEHDILEVDNARVRAGRDEAQVRAALDALEQAAKNPPRIGEGDHAEHGGGGVVQGSEPPPSSL